MSVPAKRRAWLTAALLLVLVWGAVVWTRPGLPTPGGVSDTLPALRLEHLDGRSVDLASFRGRPMVLNLWASWCAPCRRELPMMSRLAQQRPEVTFVFVDQREARPQVEAYLAEQALSLDWVLLDPHGDLADRVHASGLPVTLFFDASGTLVDRHLGEIDTVELFNALTALGPR